MADSQAEDIGAVSDTDARIEVIRHSSYEEQMVQLKVGNEIYRVSSGRLMLRSALFKHVFNLPQGSASVSQPVEPIDCSDVDPDAFKDYMWYIHADPFSSQRFFALPPSRERCTRLLGIAIVAHRFQATEVSEWASKEALTMLRQTTPAFEVDVTVAKLLLELASRLRAPEQSDVVTGCKDIFCDALHPDRAGPLSVDPIAALIVARDDDYILAHVYFYILRKGRAYDWKIDARLLPVDRRRLLCGLYGLGADLPGGAPKVLFPAEPTRINRSRRSRAGIHHGGGNTDWAAPDGDVRSIAQNAAPGEWQPRIHPDIAGQRNELWAYFDDRSWRIAE